MAKNSKERKLDAKLIQVYEKHGLDMFVDVCAEMLNIKDPHDWEKKKKVNGEVCECVIRVMTEDYLRRRGIKGGVFHSLVLKNLSNPKSDFRTELDFTLLTPYFCVTAECKSFVGQITVTGDCILQRDNLTADVGRQTKVHVNALRPYLEKYALPNKGMVAPPLFPVCFLYSNGTLQDKRGGQQRSAIPILTIGNLFRYYDALTGKCSREVYDVKAASKAFQAMADSRVLHIQHANYVGY